MYRGADKSLARPTSRCILFDGEHISFNASLVMYINITNIPPIVIINRIFIIIGIQPLGRSGQRPEFSQATGMALVRCILGKFLGVACHCFPPLLMFPLFTIRCLHVRHDVRDPSGGSGNCGRECCPVILPK